MILRTAAADCVIVTYKLMLDMSHFRLLWNSSKLRLLDLTGTERPLCDTLIEHVPLTSLEVLYLARSASAKETNLPQILAAVSVTPPLLKQPVHYKTAHLQICAECANKYPCAFSYSVATP